MNLRRRSVLRDPSYVQNLILFSSWDKGFVFFTWRLLRLALSEQDEEEVDEELDEEEGELLWYFQGCRRLRPREEGEVPLEDEEEIDCEEEVEVE